MSETTRAGLSTNTIPQGCLLQIRIELHKTLSYSTCKFWYLGSYIAGCFLERPAATVAPFASKRDHAGTAELPCPRPGNFRNPAGLVVSCTAPGLSLKIDSMHIVHITQSISMYVFMCMYRCSMWRYLRVCRYIYIYMYMYTSVCI